MKQLVHIDYRKIENVEHGSFDYMGKHWTTESVSHRASGLVNQMTNGEECATVRKDKVLQANREAAVKLFN